MEEIITREYNIANIFQTKESSKLMDLELSVSLERAVEIYTKVVDNSPFGVLADKALYKSAECYRRMNKYNEAIDAYERIVNDYPESELVAEAKYQLAYTKYEASLDAQYTQESTEDALKEFEQIKKNTPVPQIAQEAGVMLDELKKRKADSILNIAHFYERQKKYASAVMYYKDVVGKFPGTDVAAQAQSKIDELEKKVVSK